MKLADSITLLRGVGPRKARALGQLGIQTVEDLLNHYPSRVEFPPEPARLRGLEAGTVASTFGKVEAVHTDRYDRDFVCRITTAFGEQISVRWFNAGSYMRRLVQKGTGIMLFGKYGDLGTEFANPEFRVFPANSQANLDNLRVVTYPVTSGITSRELSRYVKQVLHLASPNIRAIHDPVDKAAYEEAVRKEKYAELFYMQLALAVRSEHRKQVAPNVHCVPTPCSLEGYFPFKFTKDQQQAIWDVHGDLCSGKTMNRLLQGDVGCGKTAIAAYAAMVVACNGGQTAILCPTQVLAEQHYKTVNGLFEGAGLKCHLYVGGQAKKKACTPADILVGTTAILSDNVLWKNLGLAIIDEQQKFGVEQRAALQQHGNPHVLMMTATPIPRTIAMTAFGDLDVSVIKEMPPGRMPVKTQWIKLYETTDQDDLLYTLRDELAKGNQVYVVCPRIEALDDEMRAVEEVWQEYRSLFPKASVGMLHGKMTKDEKTDAIAWWNWPPAYGRILVATTVVEVGVDNPNATVMVVEGAERFGLATLHQLRGRVGRSDKQSYCFLLSDTESGDGRARLRAMESTNDGFEIAEQDIKLRGPGDMLGTQQHGLPELRIADLVEDFDLMVEARDEARAIAGKMDYAPYMYHIAELRRRHGDVLHLGGIG